MSPVVTVPEIRVLSRTTGGAPLIGIRGRRRTKGGDEERGGWKRPEEPQRPLPGDLWRAAWRRLWPPPPHAIGRRGGESARARGGHQRQAGRGSRGHPRCHWRPPATAGLLLAKSKKRRPAPTWTTPAESEPGKKTSLLTDLNSMIPINQNEFLELSYIFPFQRGSLGVVWCVCDVK